VFAAGNVLTGKGNIKDSLDSGTEIGTLVAENYLGLTDAGPTISDVARQNAAAEATQVASAMDSRPKLPRERVDAVLAKVRARQHAVGYSGNYREWIAKVTPPDLQ
jgi:hypothetical protein